MNTNTHCYLATFPAGTFPLILRELKKIPIRELKIIQNDASAVLFDATLRVEKLIEMRFFTNVFLVLDQANLLQYRSYIKGDSFRLMALVDGVPVPLEASRRKALVSVVSEALQVSPNKGRYSNDFVLIKRGTEELLTLKLSRAKHKRDVFSAGALRPELAHLLLLAAGIKAKDVLLDPFAGHGSILIEAMRGFGVKKTVAIEKDPRLAMQLHNLQLQAFEGDAVDLAKIPSASVDKVVTDPPWGLHNQLEDATLHILYTQALSEIRRVLRPAGIVVLLSGNELLDSVANEIPELEELKVYPILVAGKKARIIKLRKRPVKK